MGPWGGRVRGPRAPSAPYGQGTKGPMGPLGVIPKSFRVGGYFEWVVILSVTVRGNCFIAQQNRLSMRCCDGRTSSRSKRKFLQSGETWGHLILGPENRAFKPTFFRIGKTSSFPKIPETESHPKPSSKRVENALFATLFSHL